MSATDIYDQLTEYCDCLSTGCDNQITEKDVQEIIDLILFIASEKGQFINGENIMIDGGRNALKREKYH